MTNTFKLQDGKLLVRTVVWVYRAYTARDFHPDYFPTEMRAWMQAIDDHLSPQDSLVIKSVYEFLVDHHTHFVAQANAEQKSPDVSQIDTHQEHKQHLIEAMLRGDEKGALGIANGFVHSNLLHRDFMLQVVQPALIDIGILWETGRINVAQEHLATAVARRISKGCRTWVAGVWVAMRAARRFVELHFQKATAVDFIRKRFVDVNDTCVCLRFS